MSLVMVSGDEESVFVVEMVGAVEAAASLESVIMLRMADRRVPAHSPRWRIRQARVKRGLGSRGGGLLCYLEIEVV